MAFLKFDSRHDMSIVVFCKYREHAIEFVNRTSVCITLKRLQTGYELSCKQKRFLPTFVCRILETAMSLCRFRHHNPPPPPDREHVIYTTIFCSVEFEPLFPQDPIYPLGVSYYRQIRKPCPQSGIDISDTNPNISLGPT